MENSLENVVTELSKSNSGDKEDPKPEMTPRKLKILISVIYGNLFLGSCYSLMAPFFPAEAESKGASPTSYGLVFGIYQLGMCGSSMFYGKIIPKLKPGFMLKVGMMVSGICVILFGLLEYAPAGPKFIWLAGVVRFVDALGASAFLTASYTTLGCEMSEIIGRAMSITETAFALGMAGGPVLGGVLYDAGGFMLPFIVIGALLLLGTVINFFLFEDDADIPPQEVSAFKLLTDLDFLIDILAVGSCFGLIGFNEVSLEPHIRQFNLSSTTLGLIFLIGGLVDASISPVWGYFAEKMENAQYLTFIGALLFIICYLLVGPVSFLHLPTKLWLIILSQFFLGLGMASEIVCSFTHGLKHMVKKGFPDDVSTYSLVSCILFSSACFGAFVGPSLGGYLIDEIGYIRTTEAVVVFKIVVALVCLSRITFLSLTKKNLEKEAIVQK